MAKKEELESTWSIDEVLDANEVIDSWHEAEVAASKKGGKR